MGVRNLTTKLLLLALAALLPAASLAAAPTGARHQRTIHTDGVDVPLLEPEGIACDEGGAVVVADTGNGRLLVFEWKDGVLKGGNQIKLGQLTYPVRVQIDSKGVVLALDRRTKKIVRLDAGGKFAGYVEPKGAPAPVIPAAFRVGPNDDVYVLDVVAAKVLVLSSAGAVKKELPLPAGVKGITDVAVDSTGRMFLVDGVTATVFSADPQATAFKPLSASLKESISFPTYIAPDNHGKLYVVDQNGHAVVKLGVDGSFQGRELAGGWADGALHYPAQFCLGSGGDLLLADRENNRVQIFTLPR
jgi:DNA-binding beta-propeller fold protein YncE